MIAHLIASQLIQCLQISHASPPLHAKVELIAPFEAISPSQSFEVGIHITPQEGWHTYWSNPGDTGLPPEMRWSHEKAIEVSSLAFPKPEAIPIGRLMNFGYKSETLFIAQVSWATPSTTGITSDTLKLKGEFKYLICKDVCLPESIELELKLPIANKSIPHKDLQNLFQTFREQLPKPIGSVHPKTQIRITESQDSFLITLSPFPKQERLNYFFPELGTPIQPDVTPSIKREGPNVQIRLRKLKTENTPSSTISGVLAGTNSYSILLPIEGRQNQLLGNTSDRSALASNSTLFFLQMMLFAFIGGLILNLMPCVFPVVSIKISHFIKTKTSSTHRQSIFYYFLGNLVTFWILAALIVILQFFGNTIGWGFQLQSPAFVLGLMILFAVLGLSFLDMIPLDLNRFLPKRPMVATNDFMSGALAVLVASPCTAPLMGSAMGYALTQKTQITFLVFTSLAIGFGSPMLFFAFFPVAFKWLPKPGIWMVRLKQYLSIPLFLTAIWLGGVFAQQMDWVKIQPEDGWQTYSQKVVEAAQKSRRPVFVDFTAAWCITCKVNETTSLHDPRVLAAFQNKQTLLLKADFTNQNREIAEILKSFNHPGVPLYLLYPGVPGSKPIVLPQILTPELVIQKIGEI